MSNCVRCGAEITDSNCVPSQRNRKTKECKSCLIARLEAWRAKNPKKVAKAVSSWKQRNPDRVNKSNQKCRFNLKLEVLIHYSGTDPPQCVNPFGEHKEPYTTIEALSIDHPKGDGAQERRKGKVGAHTYWWLKKHHYPKGYQVMCMNCQWIKRHRNKEFGKKIYKGRGEGVTRERNGNHNS